MSLDLTVSSVTTLELNETSELRVLAARLPVCVPRDIVMRPVLAVDKGRERLSAALQAERSFYDACLVGLLVPALTTLGVQYGEAKHASLGSYRLCPASTKRPTLRTIFLRSCSADSDWRMSGGQLTAGRR